MNENPKVFISYSHQDTVYENKVLEFSNKLRSEGIDASIDLYEEAPSEGGLVGWKIKSENQIMFWCCVVNHIMKSSIRMKKVKVLLGKLV